MYLFYSYDCLTSLNERARNQGVRTLVKEITSSSGTLTTATSAAAAMDSNTLPSDSSPADTVTVAAATAEEILAKTEYAHSPIQVSYFCLLISFK